MAVDFRDIERRLNFVIKQSQKVDLLNSPETLYHYTKFEGAKGILNSKFFWMFDVNTLNDTTEIETGKAVLKNVINNRLRSLPNSASYELWQSVADKLYNIDENFNFYVCSFSAESDNYLNWTKHGDDEKGFNIGLSRNYFLRLIDNSAGMPLVIGKVNYSENDLENRINNLMKLTEDFLVPFYGKLKKKSHAKKLFLSILIPIAAQLLAEICCVKDPFFLQQGEYRIVAVYDKNKPHRDYLECNKRCVYSPVFRDDDIVEITAGGATTKENKKFFSDLNIHMNISKSKPREV